MKVCVLQPDYSTTSVDYKNYDPPRNLSALLQGCEVDHVFLNKLTTYRQLKNLSRKNYDIYVNLCEGYLEWMVPSIDVIQSLELLNLPYTGPSATLYDPTKPLMKYVAYCAGVKTPAFVEVGDLKDLAEVYGKLNYPLFVKPAHAGDSLGIDEWSLVNNNNELESKVKSLLADEYFDILVEEYIAGREYTVLVVANAGPGNSCKVYKPVEYVFPENRKFKTYALKTSELHTDANVSCDNVHLDKRLRAAAEKIFKGFSGTGYARLDFRVDSKKDIFFLEINFTCSVFYENGYEGSADYILRNDTEGKSGFLQHIIAEGKARHIARQKKYGIKRNSLNGYGIFAVRPIKKDEVVFKLEESTQRIVTKSYVEQNWTPEQIEQFRHYAYPVSDQVYILWDNDPTNWAPQNHSCEPNTGYSGLNVVALKNIKKGEELTLDYAELMDSTIGSFECTCGSANCRKIVSGSNGNSISRRENDKWPVPVS